MTASSITPITHPQALPVAAAFLATAERLLAETEHLARELRTFAAVAQPLVPADDLDEVTERERDVLALVAEGLSNEEIAARLYLSVRTVERHLSNVYVKLGVTGKAARAAVAARYSRAGWPQP